MSEEYREYVRWKMRQQRIVPKEVKHGRWVDRWFCSNYSGYDYGMNCSVCGKPMHRQLAEKMPPYCPNCGAKMDEVDKNE